MEDLNSFANDNGIVADSNQADSESESNMDTEMNANNETSDVGETTVDDGGGDDDGSRTRRKSRKSTTTPANERKSLKRKSVGNSEYEPESKIPKFESVPVKMATKTIYITEAEKKSYHMLDRTKLTSIPDKLGDFEVGDMVWAKMSGFPWWPCMVSIDPNSGNYTKVAGYSSKAGRVYHVQYFGSQPSRSWTNIGMVMPYEGYTKYYNKILNEAKDLPKKQADKVIAKYSMKANIKKKWNESVAEAEEALKLTQVDRVRLLTYSYVVKTDSNEAKKRPSTTKRSVEVSTKNSSTPSSKKSLSAPEDVYNFDDDSEGFDNGLPGLSFPKRALKGDFQVYLRKHFDEESKANPNMSKVEITDSLKDKWNLLDEEMRSIYVERKAIYEDESNMLVSKRSNFEDNYFNDDSDYDDYNDSDNNSDNQNGFEQPNNISTTDEEKTKKSENLFDKIKNEEVPNADSGAPASGETRARSKRNSTAPNSASKKKQAVETTNSTSKETKSPKTPKVANLNTSKSSISIVKRMLIESDESESDDMNNNDPNVVDNNKKPFSSDIFCYECADEENIDDERVTCKGVCGRIFHKKCAKYEGGNNSFICTECFNNKHKCFACKDPDNFDTKKCEDKNCFLYYHLNCIELRYPIKVNESANSFLCPHHSCLSCYHLSLNDKFDRTNKRKLLKCVFCPVTYHAQQNCIAAGTVRISKNFVICPEHYQTLKSNGKSKSNDNHINVNYCFSCGTVGNLVCCDSCPAAFHEACLEAPFDPDKQFYCVDCSMLKQLKYNDIVWVKLGSYRWWPSRICHPNNVPNNVLNKKHNIGEFPVYFFGSHDYYWVNKGRTLLYLEEDNKNLLSNPGKSSGKLQALFNKAMKEAAEDFEKWQDELDKANSTNIRNKYPSYQHITCNKYYGKSNGNGNGNDVSPHVCDCKESDPDACGNDNCLNRIILLECDPKYCPAKEHCKNQRFKKCQYVQCKPFRTAKMGWGLKTLQDIKKGDFVIEYCGEIIDNKECDARLEKIAKNQSNFYFLTLDKDTVIDAGPKGNFSRFINHSCDPNCETQKWMVNGLYRIGVFAKKDIPADTELSFNYFLDSRGNEKMKCHCGAGNCTGYFGVTLKSEENGTKKTENGSKAKNGKKSTASR